ncbi:MULTISPECIES: hypothetical protein [Paenibacillus]|uniref:hypothetical protein n=1 Tax=Paenibacillus TaxID=44249 RepID=UPI0022B910BF|nr:hypothetical protein [Paenibacillus caseinilyticus]MCZ8523518.1 hypothetical protein [Paenibacillus caseinilyticus]
MGISAGLFLLSAFIAYREIPRMRRERRHRDLFAFTVLLLAATTLGILHASRVPLPNPLDWMLAIYQPVTRGLNILIGWKELQG